VKHFTEEDLKSVLLKIKDGTILLPEEAETLKRYIPMQLNKEQADQMSQMIEEIRNGERAPLSMEEREEMHRNNMQKSLENMILQLPQMNDAQFIEVCNMCETLRRQIARI
jgi:uncharacterized membrane protein